MINFVIVGCGHIAKKHIEAIDKVDGANLVAVCDNNPERLKEYTNLYKVKGFLYLQEMLDEIDVDVVNICTPSGLHAMLAVQAANAGKHVIVEKPIAMSLEETDQIIEACKNNNVKLSVVHPNRFRPGMQLMKNLIDEGQFGKISHANATVRWNRNQTYFDQAPWRGTKALDGGVLLNQAIHNLDLLLWLLGDVHEVSSFNATRLRNIEADDVSVGLVRFKSGALAVIEAAVTIYPQSLEESISIFGETGTMSISGVTANQVKDFTFEKISKERATELVDKVNNNSTAVSGHQCIIENMVSAILKGEEPVVTGIDGRKVLSLISALNLSAETNATVKFD